MFSKLCLKTRSTVQKMDAVCSFETLVTIYQAARHHIRKDSRCLRIVTVFCLPCSLVDRYQRFGGTCCLHLQVNEVFIQQFLKSGRLYCDTVLAMNNLIPLEVDEVSSCYIPKSCAVPSYDTSCSGRDVELCPGTPLKVVGR
jgi:hypothetical protein